MAMTEVQSPLSDAGKTSQIENEDDEEIEESKEDGVLFYQNRSGIPVDDKTWARMWSHATKIHPDGVNKVQSIKAQESWSEVPIPQAPLTFPLNTPISDRLDAVQKYMNDLQYNHTGTQFYDIRKFRPISGHMECAKEMVKEALPIKCLEATILGIYLTNGMPGVDRFMISFKSAFMGCTYRHVVLGTYYCGLYGALGMSRRKDLMYKKLKYKNLSFLINDYITAYSKYQHSLKKVKIGLPIPHDAHSYEQINWKTLTVNANKSNLQDTFKELDRFARDMRAQSSKMESLYTAYASASKTLKNIISTTDGSSHKKHSTHKKGTGSSSKISKTDKKLKKSINSKTGEMKSDLNAKALENAATSEEAPTAQPEKQIEVPDGDGKKPLTLKPLDSQYHVKI